MLAPTRRGFLAGALAGTALPLLGRGTDAVAATPGPLQAEQVIVRRGRAIAVSRNGKVLVVAHDRRTTIATRPAGRGATRIIDVGGQPVEVAVSPDGRYAAVTLAFTEKPGLAIVDLRSGAVHARVAVGPAPFAVAFTAGGSRLLVAGGEQEGALHVLDTKDFTVVRRTVVGLVPRGIAVARGGGSVWVALNAEERIVRVDLRSGRITRTLRTPALPDRIAVSPDGRRLLVSHGGPDAGRVSEIEVASRRVHHHAVGRLPSGVGWTPRGRRLVALGGAGQVVALGRPRRRVRGDIGGQPRGLAVAGERAWTVDDLTGQISGVRV